MIDITKLKQLALAVIDTETQAVANLRDRINDDFIHACELLLQVEGRIVVIGMGKSGHIANKLAATLASTGSPAFFVHPGEASHGDMGMIMDRDVIITISNSGTTPEIVTILPLIKRLGCPIISLTGNPDSVMAKAATVNLDVSVDKEACPLGLAPTASTTATLVMGDALAIALLQARGFTENDFALSHPGGALGKRLLLHVSELMHTDDDLPQVNAGTSLKDSLLEMTNKRLGMTTVLDDKQQLLGIFTDGDIRRALDHNVNINDTIIDDVMSKNSKTITADRLAVDALEMMESNKITSLVVLDDAKVIGVVHLHDLLKAGV
tara:strand:+ start:29188 stop:30156 length:969 start_codon:yes stop_codon:yes gene_type:complete